MSGNTSLPLKYASENYELIPEYPASQISSSFVDIDPLSNPILFISRKTNIIDGLLEIPKGKIIKFVHFQEQENTLKQTTRPVEVFVEDFGIPLNNSGKEMRNFYFTDEAGSTFSGKIIIVDDDTLKLRTFGIIEGGKIQSYTGVVA